jgi:serine/threonine-protein kinase
MTTRDSRSRDPRRPASEGGSGRDPTQSLEIELQPEDLEAGSQPPLAMGTHDHTKAESPQGRSKPVSRPEIRGSGGRPMPNADDPEAYIGATLGTYRVAELLGKGGMGYVYRAEHVKLGREVALKLLRADYSRRRDSVARFFQEARTVNRVRHRNIVDVTDFVELDDGTTFIIMELLTGTSLGKWARTGIDLPRALAVLVQICDGLGAAHAVGVVHRDLKPDNVVVVPTSDGAELVKLLDFGVAKLLNRDDEDIGFQTAAGSVIGTPAYMSPEQAGGMSLDHRSDIYSLGAIMYELFCGQPMFRGRSFGEYVRKHLTEQPVPPRQTAMGGGIDPRLEALILKCLEKEPSLRFDHILELRDGLLQLLGGLDTHPPGMSATTSGIQLSPLPIAPMQHMPTPISQLSHHNSAVQYYSNSGMYSGAARVPEAPTPWWVWLSGGMFAVAVGIAAALWYAGRTEDKPLVAPRAAPPPPSVAAIAPIEVPATKPTMIEVRFDSLPEGHVYADGRSAELCKTPCAFDIDVKDGGDKRTFVVKSDGYKDGIVVVDLTASQREFRVSLEPNVVVETPQPVPHAKDDTKAVRPVKRPIIKKIMATKDDTKATASSVKDDTKKADDRLMKPDDDKTGTETKPKPTSSDTIDPAETLDPFKRHKP